RGRAPVHPQIEAVENHLRLILSLRASEAGVHVQVLRPREVAAEGEIATESTREVDLERVIAAVALRVPKEARAQVWIRPGRDCRNVPRTLRHRTPRPADASRLASRRLRADRRRPRG